MSQQAQTILPTTTTIGRQSVARNANLCVVMNAYKMLYESSHLSGVFNRIIDLGFDTPNAAPTLGSIGAGNVDGTRGYLITFYNSDRDLESNPFNPDSPVTIVASTDEVRVTRTDTNSGDNALWTHWRVYRNDSDTSSTYYRLATIAIGTTTYDDNATDASIRTATSIDLDNDKPEASTYTFCFTHKGYTFLAGDQYFIWSKLHKPHAYPLVNKTAIERGLYGEVILITPIGDIAVFLKDDATYELHYDSNPSGTAGDGYGKTMNVERGVVNESCVVNVRGVLYIMDRWGIYQTRGGLEENQLDLPLRGIWRRINWRQRDKFCSVQTAAAAYWFVALDNNTECQYAFVLDLESIRAGSVPRWYLHKYPFPMRHLCQFRTDDAAATRVVHASWRTVACFVTQHGNVGILEAGYRDLCPPQCTAEGTVTGASSTSITDSAATFSRTNEASNTENVRGAYLWFPDYPELGYHRINSITGTTQIHFTAFGTTPVVGWRYVVGVIPDVEYRTPLLGFGNNSAIKKSKEVIFEYQPMGVTRDMGYEVEFDRRGSVMAERTDSRTDHVQTANSVRPIVEMGGDLDEGRYAAKKHGVPADGFRLAQVILNATGVDNHFVVDAIELRLSDMEGQGGGNDG